MSAPKTDGRVSRAQKLRESRRAQVMQVARQIFAQKGYHATSIDDLIEAAGIARGTFYLYFESKRAIFDELLDELLALLQSNVHRIDTSPGAPPPIEQLNAIVAKVLGTLVAEREIAQILLREAVGLDEHFDRKLADFYGRIENMIERAIRTGQSMELVRACDAQVVARCILGAVKEVVHHAVVGRDPHALDAGMIGALGREVIAFTLQGLFK